MLHSLTTTPPSPISSNIPNNVTLLGFQSHRNSACKPISDARLLHRRTLSLGLAGAMLGLSISSGERASAAARRPPPPPPGEKKDPNASGVQAKVLASKKRKEAMKESIAKLRERGKVINQQSNPTTTAEAEPSE